MEEIIKTLQTAIGTGELVNIIYNGGSEPGKSRMIIPIKIDGGKVRARCYVTNAVKTFNIDKMILSPTDQFDYTGGHKDPETLQDAIAPFMDELKSLGWEIDIDDYGIGLFSYFKNGKRRKMPDVSLHYSETSESWDKDFGYEEDRTIKDKSRPWYVHGHSFKYLSKAIVKFMDYATERAPKK